jgi:hypothetical protein
MKKTICIDFDGCIAQVTPEFQVDVFGQPVEGAKEAMEVLKKNGYTLIIFTTRKATAKLKKYLADNSIPYDAINQNPDQPDDANPGKPLADIYVDNRGIGFHGNWGHTLGDIAYFRPYSEDKRDRKKEYDNTCEEYKKYAKKHQMGMSCG